MTVMLAFAGIQFSGAQSLSGTALLDRMAGHRVSFDYDCTFNGMSVAGEVTLQDRAFVMKGFGLEVYSDGDTRWSVDTAAEEVLIERESGSDILSDPGRLIGAYRDFFDVSGNRLVPKGTADSNISYISIDSCTEKTLEASVSLSDGTVARFSLKNIVLAEPGPASDFSFDTAAAGSSYIITDLR